MTKIEGIIAPLLTPFDANDQVDYEKFTANVQRISAAGVHGVSPGGSTGEGAALSDDELAELIRIAKANVTPEQSVVAGVIRTSTHAAVQTALRAKEAGADALMVTPVFYNVLVPSIEGNLEFYQRISDAAGLPIVIYNVVPQNEITPEDFKQLLQIEHVVGIKQSLLSVPGMYAMRVAAPQPAQVFAATDEMLYSCFALGADGAISAILSLFPELSVKIWDLTRSGQHEEALKIQDQLFPVWMSIIGPQFPARMKAASKLMGFDCGLTRSPSSPVPADVLEKMRSALVAANLLEG